MKPILESSIAVRSVRWVFRESLLAAGVRTFVNMFSSVDRAFERAAAAKDSQVDPDRVRTLLYSSAIVRAIDAVFSAPFAAWEGSRVRPFVDGVRESIAAMSIPERIRLGGWMLLVALVTRAALYVAGGWTLTTWTLGVWAVVFSVSVILMSLPEQIAAGWADWKSRRG